ncbi:predicted protein [Sclerotinia sclerotiorum 1980 UF-70]|uniref:Uncharacterized protein n=1 Tax=Sclerotinia sclerotiorum (strain ATCC 18683 / 1980 / Ss-1) TaxID=665079 RepID=A7EL10_SCLS1|nr:predicted protein [Sclerotinia sclerotiorum 1980 UF-70]EDO03526.1 predicted protein [Sclerotinia sclerotiorum 1980 UF-70]
MALLTRMAREIHHNAQSLNPAISEFPDTAGQSPHLLSSQAAKDFPPEGGDWTQ